MKPYEMPPVLTGTTQQQLQQMRDYLARLVLELNRRSQNQ